MVKGGEEFISGGRGFALNECRNYHLAYIRDFQGHVNYELSATLCKLPKADSEKKQIGSSCEITNLNKAL